MVYVSVCESPWATLAFFITFITFSFFPLFQVLLFIPTLFLCSGWMISSQIHVYFVAQNVILFGNMAFADVNS